MGTMKELIQELDILELRLNSGQSFAQASRSAASIESVGSKWQELWFEVSDGIVKGQLSALESVRAFRDSLSFEYRAEKLRKKKALLPSVQAWSVAGSSILFYFCLKFFFGQTVVIPLSLELLVGLLLTSGILWIAHLLKMYKASFWVIDWLRTQTLILSQLKWGHSLHKALKQRQKGGEDWPKEIRQWFTAANSASMHHKQSPEALSCRESSHLEKKFSSYWRFCLEQFRKNENFVPLMEAHIQRETKSFEELCETNAEWLSVKLMLPLFLCFCPAFMILCFGPMLTRLTQFA